MNVLISGSSGFLGSHLVKYILEHTTWNIYALDIKINKRYSPEYYNSELYRINTILYNIADENCISYLLKSIPKIDKIFHLAAKSHVPDSIKFPREFIETNTIGTANLLEYARLSNNKPIFVNFTSNEQYGPIGIGGSKEEDSYNCTNIYAGSKAAQTILCQAYHKTFNIPVLNLVSQNIIGPGLPDNRFIGIIVKKALAGESITVYPGERSYVYAEDVCSAIVFVSTIQIPNGQSFNIPAQGILSNKQLVVEVLKRLDINVPIIETNPDCDRLIEDYRYCIDGSKLLKTGFKHKYSYNQMLDNTINYYINKFKS